MKSIGGKIVAAAVGVGVVGAIARSTLRSARYYSLVSKTVLITGGARGLGLNIARTCVARGANIAICSRNGEQVGRAKVELLRRGAREVFAATCDVTDRAQLDGFIRDVVTRFGTVDVLVNNAGTIEVGPMRMMELADFQRAMATHFEGPLNATLAVLPLMRAARGGRIVNVASIGGKVAVPHLLPYCASKHALVGLSEGMRAELASENIFVTTVIPGLFRSGSPRNASFKGRVDEEYAWFATGDALPGMSMRVERLAKQIVDAMQHGDAELISPTWAKLNAAFATACPNVMAELMTLTNRLLPSPGGTRRRMRGREVNPSPTPALVKRLNARAAVANNEI